MQSSLGLRIWSTLKLGDRVKGPCGVGTVEAFDMEGQVFVQYEPPYGRIWHAPTILEYIPQLPDLSFSLEELTHEDW